MNRELSQPGALRAAERQTALQSEHAAGRAWPGMLAPLASLIVTVVVLAAAFLRVWPLTVDLGQQDARFAIGFHEPEQFGDMLFRWTTGHSELDLPAPPAGTALLTLRILNGYPETQSDPRLTLSADGHALGAFDVTRQGSGMRRYLLLAPIAERPAWPLRLTLDSTTYAPPGDPRPLGVVLDWARLAPTTESSPMPPAWLLISAAVLGLLSYVAGRLAGVARWLACAVALLVGLALAVLLGMRPLDALPFLTRLAFVPAIACIGLLLVRLLVPIERDASTGAASVAGIYLPILMALAWWMLPIFQVAQRLDGAAIGLGDDTLWIGGGTALALLVVVGGWWLARGRALPAELRRPAAARLALGTLGAMAAVHLVSMLAYAFTRSGKDFWILFKGTRDWVRGGSLYDLNAVVTNHVGAVFKVPPFYGMLFTPFVFQDGLQILFYHRILNVGIMIATALLILYLWRVKPLWWGLAALAIVFNSRPLADTVAFGQIDLLLLLLLTGALWALRSERDLLAGVLVALGTLFKIYPVILLAFFMLKGRWRVLIGFALGMLAANGLAIAVMGWEMHRVYLFEVLPRIGGTTSWVENQTISAFLARLVDAPFDAHLFDNRALALAGTAISAALSALACWISMRPARSDSTIFALQYAQFLLLMVLAVPAAWMHYETLLVLVFVVVLMHLRERHVALPHAIGLAIGFALVSYGNQWSFNGTTVMGLLTVLGVSYKFYGMVLLGAVMLYYLVEEPAPVVVPVIGRFVPRLGQR